MKIIRWWKNYELVPGVTWCCVEGEATSEGGFIDQIIECVKTRTDFDYEIIEQVDTVVDSRGTK